MEKKEDKWIKGVRITYTGRIDGWGQDRCKKDLAGLMSKMIAHAEISMLEKLDESVAGDEHPDAMATIMAAYEKHR